jgi:hypothetical protein
VPLTSGGARLIARPQGTAEAGRTIEARHGRIADCARAGEKALAAGQNTAVARTRP